MRSGPLPPPSLSSPPPPLSKLLPDARTSERKGRSSPLASVELSRANDVRDRGGGGGGGGGDDTSGRPFSAPAWAAAKAHPSLSSEAQTTLLLVESIDGERVCLFSVSKLLELTLGVRFDGATEVW